MSIQSCQGTKGNRDFVSFAYERTYNINLIPILAVIRQVEQKPGGREYNNLQFKMHYDSIITRTL